MMLNMFTICMKNITVKKVIEIAMEIINVSKKKL